MKLASNKILLIGMFMLSLCGFAKQSPPPPPAGTPPPPGYPIDENLFLLMSLGIVFSFIFFVKYVNQTKKA